MKKNFFCLSVILSLITASAFADLNKFPTGLFLGVAGGYHQIKGTESSTVTVVNGPPERQVNPNSRFSNSSSALQVLLGYLHKFENNITLGGTFFYNYFGGQTSHRKSNTLPGAVVHTIINSQLRFRDEFGFYATLGYVMKDFYHPYILTGISSKHFQEITSFDIFDTGVPSQFQITDKKNVRQTSYLCGAGIELPFGKIRYGIQGIYGYVLHKPIRTFANIPDGGLGNNISTEFRRRSEHSFLFLVKATYNFDIFN